MANEEECRKSDVDALDTSRETNAPLTSAPSGRPLAIVAIGASAGGLEAVAALLKHLPADTGFGFVLVQHLDPSHESSLSAILSRATTMRVIEASHNAAIERDCVYVIPPGKLMTAKGGVLRLSPRGPDDFSMAIDHFFGSLADAEGAHAIGVVLSGTGSDGTHGLLSIKAAGGITFAQEEKSAKYPAMPRNAILSGCVDFVRTAEQIAQELGRLARHPLMTNSPGVLLKQELETTAQEPIKSILRLLRDRTAVDFTHYKEATLRRRIQRRMILARCETLSAYADFAHADSAEVMSLYRDILIHVTEFFRDSYAFEVLGKKILPQLLKSKPEKEALRIWVPGCSTGEEVYSLAIALLEVLSDRKLQNPVQIFGTDINEAALEKARAGTYPDTIRSNVDPDRLRRFFVRTEGGFRITRGIRELCIFARQNLVADPPFSNVDLISCRNVLIYLGQPLQKRVMPIFHHALKPSGFLMLGSSETIGGFAELFSLVDKRAKIYSKKAGSLRHLPSYRPSPAFRLEKSVAAAPNSRQAGVPAMPDIQAQAERILLTEVCPAGVIVNEHLDVIHFRGNTGAYLEHPQGEASLNLLKMARPEMMLQLRTLTARAIKERVRTRIAGVRLSGSSGSTLVNLEAVPFGIEGLGGFFYLILFEPDGPASPAPKGRGKAARVQAEADRVEMNRMVEELSATRETLQAIIEEQEATNEELRSANEEIMSSNEELQSTNEELETAKEELQSTNEELTTLNDELESRNTELEEVNNDLHNLLSSVNIPIIMLGHDLRIRRFTALAERLFNLIAGDIGRPITDIKLPVDIPNLREVVTEVIDTLSLKDQELQDRNARWWSLRVRPYKTMDHKIDGAVLVLVDIDAIKTSMQRISAGRQVAEAVVNAVKEPLLVLDGDYRIEFANDAFLKLFQTTSEETVNRSLFDLGGGEWDAKELKVLLQEVLPLNAHFEGFKFSASFPGRDGPRDLLLDAHRIDIEEGKARMIFLGIRDVTPRTAEPYRHE